MANKELENYIKKQLNSGYSLEQIKDVLIKRGWQETHVSEAISSLQQETAGMKLPKKGSNKKLIAAVIIIVVVCLVGVPLFLVFYLGMFNQAGSDFSIATGFGIFGRPLLGDWEYSGNEFSVAFPSALSYDITITEATADDCNPITNKEIPAGTIIDLEFSSCELLSAGTVYTVEVEIKYIRSDQPFEVAELGTVSGNAL